MSDDSEPAFPQHWQTGNMEAWRHGMTLRDYFAAQLVSGLAKEPGEGCDEYMAQRARIAYAFADAMLKAREPKR